MTRKLIIVIGAIAILVINGLFVLWLLAAGLISDWKKGRGLWV